MIEHKIIMHKSFRLFSICFWLIERRPPICTRTATLCPYTTLCRAKIGGVTLSAGTTVAAKHKIDCGPSVLFDAVVVLVSAEGAALMSRDAAAKDFVTDAFAHCKFIGVGGNAEAIFVAAGISEDLDEACLPLAKAVDAATFIEACRELRFWPRELEVDLDAKPDA